MGVLVSNTAAVSPISLEISPPALTASILAAGLQAQVLIAIWRIARHSGVVTLSAIRNKMFAPLDPFGNLVLTVPIGILACFTVTLAFAIPFFILVVLGYSSGYFLGVDLFVTMLSTGLLLVVVCLAVRAVLQRVRHSD